MAYENNGYRGIPSNPILFSCIGQADCADHATFGNVDIDHSRTNMMQQARMQVSSDAQIPNGIQLLLRAGNSVEILKKFEIQPHAALEVRIEDCKISNQ